MDNSNMSKNKQNEYLGVNKIGKNIRKSPLHQPNFANSSANNNNNYNNNNNNNNNNNGIGNNQGRQQSQPQVYNISKTDFRSIVQQLTGSPSRNDPLPRPPLNNPPKHPSMRLQRIRPPPLTPMNRPPMPPVVLSQPPLLPLPQGQPMGPAQLQFNNSYVRPSPPQFNQPSPRMHQPNWTTPALSPISAYMQQLQTCIGEGGQQQMQPQYGQFQPQHPVHSQGHGHVQGQSAASGLLPNPNGPPMPSPGTNGPGLLPSPTSQFLLPSPGGYFNLLSPRSPYPLPSPGSQFPPPMSPNFAFSPFGQSGILGSGPHPPGPPLSPGISFPASPSGFFPLLSPRWRDH